MSIQINVSVKYVPGRCSSYNYAVTLQVQIGPERLTFKYVDPHGRRLLLQATAERIKEEVLLGPFSFRLQPRRLAWNRHGMRKCSGGGVVLNIGTHRFSALKSNGVTIRTRMEEDAFLAHFERAMRDHAGAHLRAHDKPL